MKTVAIFLVKLICLFRAVFSCVYHKSRFIAAALIMIFTAFAASPAYGQNARLQIDHLDRLASTAAETVDVTIDSSLLQVASKFLSSKKADEARIKELIAGLKGVYVKSFQFDNEGEYTEADVDMIRSQLRAPGWTRIVDVKSRRSGENVEVYTMIEADNVAGLAIIAAERRELTIVNIVGPIDLEKLADLEGQFGIPRFGFERMGRYKKE